MLLLLLELVLNLKAINQIINQFVQSNYYLISFEMLQLLSQLSLFSAFSPSFFYILSHHCLNQILSCYLNQTFPFFQFLIFSYFMALQQYLVSLCKDHKVLLLQIILSFHIQVLQYLHCRILRTFYLKQVLLVNYFKIPEYFQYSRKLFH